MIKSHFMLDNKMKNCNRIDIKPTKDWLMIQLSYCPLTNNYSLRKQNHLHYKVLVIKKVFIKINNTANSKTTLYIQDIIQSI